MSPFLHGYRGGQDLEPPPIGEPIVTDPVPAMPVRLVRLIATAAAWAQRLGLYAQPDGAATRRPSFGLKPYPFAEITKRTRVVVVFNIN